MTPSTRIHHSRRALGFALMLVLLAGFSLSCRSTAVAPPEAEPTDTPQLPPPGVPGVPPPEEPDEVPVEPVPAEPPPAAIVAAYVDAVGGEDAVRRHTSMRAKGKFSMPSMGLEGDLEIVGAAPNRMLVRVSVPGIGEILQGSDGEVAWADNPMTGPQVMEGEALEDALRQADFYPELNYATTYSEMETVERTEREGEEVYKVRLVDTSGKESFHYFAVSSGLLVATEGEQETPMGRVFVSSRVGGYRQFDGRLVATELHQSTMGMEQTMTLEEVDFGDVSDDTFTLPDTIRTLLD